ncbi:MAG: 16S rRNA (cytosine(1402)-N(4))-methyltransferase RsmH [Terriglobia bacterium]
MSQRSYETHAQASYRMPEQGVAFMSSAPDHESASTPIKHSPVLLKEVLEFLSPQPGGVYIDATIGLGGHTEAILEGLGNSGGVLGIDRDEEALGLASQRLARFHGRYQMVHANYADLREIARQKGITECDGILADLGVSSLQLEKAERGFSFLKDGPLDMRMDQDLALTADEVVNHYPEKDLANLIFQFGEERHSRAIARAIVRSRPLHRTGALASVIARSFRARGHGRIHPATRTFQAIRIFVNDELGKIAPFVEAAADLLKVGGRIAIITFHSLEDRIVKQTLRRLSQECSCLPGAMRCECHQRKILKVLTKKSVKATEEEVLLNPRSRSAKLRVAERI